MNHIARERVDRFNRYWEDLYRSFPAARTVAVAEMAKAVKTDLDGQILLDGVDDTFGHVRNWQEIRLGSKGGYAAVSPRRGQTVADRFGRTHTTQGKAVTARHVTRWLERGHAARKPAPGSMRQWSHCTGRAGINSRTGIRYVPGFLFYSSTRKKALTHALKAADKALGAIADEIDY